MKVTRDPRPVSQQIFSGLKIGAGMVLVGAALLIVWIYLPRYRIEAYLWHLRHGNSIDVGPYRVPVPRQWYVEHIDNSVMLINLNTGDTMSVDANPLYQRFTLSLWLDVEARAPARSDWKTTGRRDFQISGENVLCLEQDFDIKLAHVYPIHCRSNGTLEVTFQPNLKVGKTHDAEFYSLLQQVQKL